MKPETKAGLLRSWQELDSRRKNTKFGGTDREFVNYAWQGFDPLKAATVLLSNDDSIFGRNEILFAALCVWVAGPQRTDLVRASVVLTMAGVLEKAEGAFREEYAGAPELGDVMFRSSSLGRGFFSSIYYPLGGLKTIRAARSPRSLKQALKSSAAGLKHVVSMCRLWHYHALSLFDRNVYRALGTASAADVISKMEFARHDGQGPPTSRQVLVHWSAFKSAASLAYAASRIEVRPGTFLIDLIIGGRIGIYTERIRAPLVTKWLGYAKYFNDVVLSKVEFERGDSWVESVPAEVHAVEIPMPTLSEKDVAAADVLLRDLRRVGAKEFARKHNL